MDVTIIPIQPIPDEDNPFIQYICEVAHDSSFLNPVWYMGNNTLNPNILISKSKPRFAVLFNKRKNSETPSDQWVIDIIYYKKLYSEV